MSSSSTPIFHEASLRSTPIRDLGLAISGTRLAPLIERFGGELERVGIRYLKPHFYLSTEWGVPFGTISIGIPFYLARPDLLAFHVEQTGHVEGFNASDIMRYLRHEMGHVVNYAYRLYDDEQWIRMFGSITQPYLEEYRPEPFSTRFVQHLPGWYSQKHPDEDWSETFAVWMTPGEQWRAEYAAWPQALAKLEYCDAKMAELNEREPLVRDIDPDEDVSALSYSLDEFYARQAAEGEALPPGIDGALRSMFEDLGEPEESDPAVPRIPASTLMHRLERQLMSDVYRWTGHWPERTRSLLRHLAQRSDLLNQVYPRDRELEAAVALTALVTALATNYVHRGNYVD